MSGCKTDPLPDATADAVVTQSFGQANGAPVTCRGAISIAGTFLLRRAGDNRLTGLRPLRRRRIYRRALTSGGAGQVRDHGTRNAGTCAAKRNQRCTGRNNRDNRSSCRQGSTGRNRSAGRDRSARREGGTRGERERSAGGNRRSDWCTGHVSDRCTRGRRRNTHCRDRRTAGDCRTASGGRRTGTDLACRALDAGVATRYQRGGSRVRAQRHCGTAQSDAGNHFDVESIEDCHRRQLPFQTRVSPAVHQVRLKRTAAQKDDRVIFNGPVCKMHHAAPHCFQIVMFDRRLAWVVSITARENSDGSSRLAL